MNNKDKIEKIIKDTLYEESTRRMLLSAEDQVQQKGISKYIKYLAAASVIAILAIVGLLQMGGDAIDRSMIAQEAYEFPTINKSRGAENHIIDLYLTDIADGKYSEVLRQLNKENLTEKDQFAKAHLRYITKDLEGAKSILSEYQWEDEYYQEEAQWLLFIISYSSGADKQSLTAMAEQLSSAKKSKAMSLISKL